MDGRAVDRAVRELVRPTLKDVGFHRFAGRCAWRQHGQTVDAISTAGLPLIDRFTQAPNAYHALLNETSRNTEFGRVGVTMPGAPDSPRWRDTTLAIGHLVAENPREDMRKAPVLGRC
jgi:hypothetical protein